jgi:hypothetical protein
VGFLTTARHPESPFINKETTVNTNELQNEVETRNEMRELTVDELDTIGGGGGGVVNGGPVVH